MLFGDQSDLITPFLKKATSNHSGIYYFSFIKSVNEQKQTREKILSMSSGRTVSMAESEI